MLFALRWAPSRGWRWVHGLFVVERKYTVGPRASNVVNKVQDGDQSITTVRAYLLSPLRPPCL